MLICDIGKEFGYVYIIRIEKDKENRFEQVFDERQNISGQNIRLILLVNKGFQNGILVLGYSY